MALDPTIALQAQPPSFDTALKPVASLLGIQNALLNVKRGQATFDADVAQRQAESQAAQVNARVAQANEKPLIEQQAAATDLAKTQSKAAQFKLTGEQLEKASQIGSGLLSDPDISSGDATKIIPKITAAKQRMIEAGIPEQTAEVQAAHLIAIAAQHPDAVPQILKNSILQSMPAVQQASAIAPSGAVINNGQEQVLVNTNPLAGPVGPVKSTTVKNQLPPTTPTYDANTRQMGYLGSMDNPAEGGFDPSKLSPQQKAAMIKADPEAYANGLESFYKRQQAGAAPGRVVSGPPFGAEAGITGSQNTITKHWDTINDQAGRASTDIGLLQNIKRYAGDAATGVLSDREAYINGLASYLHMSSADLKKTSTDLLAKNAAMFSLAGGDTDKARILAEAANPNSKMSMGAIREAADQIISQKQMAIAQQKYLLPYKALADQGHPEAYQAAKALFDSSADPRIFQYPHMSQEEKIKMKSSMSPAEQAEFRAKAAKLKELGVLQ